MPRITSPRPPAGTNGRPPLGYLLRQAAAAHRLTMERALADIEVTPPQFLVLRLLAEHPGSSNAELSRMAALSTPTVTVIVANLTRRGALASRPHAVHGRVRHLDLTESGATLLSACKARAARAEQDLEADLAPGEAATIARWLLRSAQLGRPPEGVEDDGR